MREGDSDRSDSLSELLVRLIDAGSGVIRAEINVVRHMALERLARAQRSLALLAVGLLLALVALTVLAVGGVLALAPLLGPLAAAAILFIVLIAAAFAAVRAGQRGLADLTKVDRDDVADFMQRATEYAE